MAPVRDQGLRLLLSLLAIGWAFAWFWSPTGSLKGESGMEQAPRSWAGDELRCIPVRGYAVAPEVFDCTNPQGQTKRAHVHTQFYQPKNVD